MPFLEKGLPPEVGRPLDGGYVRQILPLVQERARTLAHVVELTDFFFNEELIYEPGS